LNPDFRHKARKRFGQNFLHDEHVINRIVEAIKPGPDQQLVEIGPGQGAITAPLMARTGRLTVIEIDRDLAAALRSRFAGQPGFHLIESDVLKVDFSTLANGPRTLRILGNLPYNISTPLLFHLLQYRDLVSDMVFMLQLEVVDRLAAGPGDADYGRLSIMMQYHCRVEKLFRVPPGAFHPQPKVDSAIVRLTPWETLPFPVRNYNLLETLVRQAFNQRRKTIRNTLRNFFSSEQLENLPIDLTLRPENLALADYARIADILDQSGTAP
jgi:16S rRNA (adenine1518-N6/adenine1519-N6)-dimethyltransferase